MTPTREMRDAFLKRRDLLVKMLREIDGLKVNVPQGAFYVFPDVSHYFGKKAGSRIIENADDFCMYLLDAANVSIVTGKAFGDEKCVRFSYSTASKTLTAAVDRIRDALKKLS
jgi:aspartate aminotransferase